MSPEILEKVLECDKLPSLPAVAVRVLELTQDQNVNIKELAATISNDQGLASKILRTVNSSFYALRKPCTSINQAVVMLGLNAVKTLALGFSLVESVSKRTTEGFDHQAYWKRSLFTGVAAKCIAVEAKCGNDEECFLGGLLQDVGMVALFQALGTQYVEVMEKTTGDHRQLVKHELADLEATHPDVGALLATRWKLPVELVMPIKYHERPTASPPEVAKIVSAVGLGNVAADVMTSSEPGVVLKRFYTRAEQWFNMKPAQADDILKKISQGTKEVAGLLNIDAGSIPSSEEISARAGEQMRAISLPFCDAPTAAAQLAGVSFVDEATGLKARDVFNQNFIAGFEQVRAGGENMSIALMEFDQHAQIFKTHGQETGDALLRGIAELLRPHFEAATTMLCRFDETRFAVFMPKTDRINAVKLTELARRMLAANPVVAKVPGLKDLPVTVSVSAGVACYDHDAATKFKEPDAFLTVVEQALAAAEGAGRNTLRAYSPQKMAA